MKKTTFILFVFLTHLLEAQTVDFQEIEFRVTLPEISLLSIKPDNSTIILNLEKTGVAGEKITFIPKTDNLLWVNYTSSKAPESPSKNLSAQIITGNVPAGLELQLKIGDYMGIGKGQFGTSASSINLQNYPQNIISNIGGSFTNEGINNGHQLEYVLVVTNYKLLDAKNSDTLTIVYTLSDN